MLDAGAASSLTITDDDRVHIRFVERDGQGYIEVDPIPIERAWLVLIEQEAPTLLLQDCQLTISDVALDGCDD